MKKCSSWLRKLGKKKQRFRLWRQKFLAGLSVLGLEAEEVSALVELVKSLDKIPYKTQSSELKELYQAVYTGWLFFPSQTMIYRKCCPLWEGNTTYAVLVPYKSYCPRRIKLIRSFQISNMTNLTNDIMLLPICLCLLFYVYMSMSVQGEDD